MSGAPVSRSTVVPVFAYALRAERRQSPTRVAFHEACARLWAIELDAECG